MNLVELLKKETATLKTQYIELTNDWAKKEFNRLESFVKENSVATSSGYYANVDVEKFQDGTSKYKYNKKYYAFVKKVNSAISVFQKSVDSFVGKAVKNAELHYEQSIEKLAFRVKQKGLNLDLLKVETAHIGVNIETVLTDGTQTVKAWTIIASGEVQKPHYRYLVK